MRATVARAMPTISRRRSTVPNRACAGKVVAKATGIAKVNTARTSPLKKVAKTQSADGVLTKAPFGGAATGANPPDRGKKGTKRSLLVDGAGIPLAVVIDGANQSA